MKTAPDAASGQTFTLRYERNLRLNHSHSCSVKVVRHTIGSPFSEVMVKQGKKHLVIAFFVKINPLFVLTTRNPSEELMQTEKMVALDYMSLHFSLDSNVSLWSNSALVKSNMAQVKTLFDRIYLSPMLCLNSMQTSQDYSF